MKNSFKRIINIVLLLTLVITVSACSEDDANIQPKYGIPTIASVNKINSGTYAVNRLFRLPLTLSAQGYLQRLEIKRNGTAFSSVDFEAGGLNNYEFSTNIDVTWLGTTQVFTFDLYDKLNQKSQTLTFTAQISAVIPTYTITEVTINNEQFKRITGIINFDETLNAATKWLLNGNVIVDEIATVTIEAGTTIYAETATTELNVLQNGKIISNGTATAPVVFTSFKTAPGQAGNPLPGDWKAINVNGNGTTTVNSGVYKYMRVEYAGGSLATGGLLDAFRFVNVGDATTIDYVQVFKSADNGLRINGGNVNVKHFVGTSNVAFGLRYGVAWSGKGQFIVVNSDAGALNGIQGRDANSTPTFSNVTLSGTGFNAATTGVGEGIRIRNNAKGNVYNALITGYDVSIRYSDGSQNFIPTNEVVFKNNASFGNASNGGTGFHSSAAVFNPTSGSYIASNNNSVATVALTASYVGTSTTNSVNPNTINTFFEAANYVGAVQTGSDWTIGWTRNANGTLR